MKKNIADKNDDNLYNLNRSLYDIIVEYGISHTYLAKHVFPDEWKEAEKLDDKEDEKIGKGNTEGKKTYYVHKVTGKLRNRLDGRGKFTDGEYNKLVSAIEHMVSDMTLKVEAARMKLANQRSKKIKSILEALDEQTRLDLKEELSKE